MPQLRSRELEGVGWRDLAAEGRALQTALGDSACPAGGKWREQNLDEANVLVEALDADGLAHDAERSADITIWVYEQGEAAGAYAWYRKGDLVRLDSSWRASMSPMLAVAESQRAYGFNADSDRS